MKPLRSRLAVSLALLASAAGAVGAAGSALSPEQAAAMRQHAEYLHAAGVAFEHGEGVPREPLRAAACYCESARQGNADGMYGLGWMYANGRGVPRDDAYAGTLFAMAAMLSHPQAERMQRFTGPYTGAVPDCLLAPAWEQDDSLIDRLMAGLPADRHPIIEQVARTAPEFGVDARFALAIASTESAFNPQALSPRNAMGVMQLIPETAARFKVRDALDPAQNIRGGLAYLRWLLAYFRGDVRLVAAAYNAGEGAVERYQGVPPYPETRAYVSRIQHFFSEQRHPYDASVVESSAVMAPFFVADR
ncbi:lytic transglycosylase domain-containing protein [Denitromonas iodatirespirans]|uniref:Transglycosylase SLT domain-containing protein n=1 Tax=Denitromonas iodatirespirans TaxID=2795389 RepID=A0A944H8F7_DENI1|nr:transglycosylase SLT domain-containing protein [Denitromonas iodatirespirans]MBT0962258.1 transglycosylase SLT domain-containing protein [Denitromonas iodatirespirans]